MHHWPLPNKFIVSDNKYSHVPELILANNVADKIVK